MTTTASAPLASGRTAGQGVRGRLRRLADAAVTPLDLDDVLDVFHPLRKGAELRGRVVEVRPETAESATLVLKPGRDWAGHVPGQYVRVGADVDGVRLWRTYSLTHGPRPDGCISITVKAIPDGVVSNHLVHRVQPGTMLQLGQADGEFVLPDPLPAKLLLVTAGSGITPVIGMLRNLYSRSARPATDIVLVHVNASESSAMFREELREHGRRGHLTLVERYDDHHGLLDVAALDTLVPDLAERLTYACGPAGLLDALEEHHTARGLPLTTERFRAPQLAAGAEGEGGTLELTATGVTVDAPGDKPLLDVAEEAGALMPSGCRIGVCFGCVLPLREGVVRDLRNGEVTVAAPGDGVAIQTCINAAAGPCTIDN